MLRPARIARIAPVKLWIARCTTAVDKQSTLGPARRRDACQYPRIILKSVTGKARITEHDDRARRPRSLIKDRQKGIGRVTLEAVFPVSPLLKEQIVANLADDPIRAFREERGHWRHILQGQDAILECYVLRGLNE